MRVRLKGICSSFNLFKRPFVYRLNEEENIAELINYYSRENVVIPYEIDYKSKKYKVKVCKNSFQKGNVECISIPSNIFEIEEGSFADTYFLKKIIVIPSGEENVKSYEDKLILIKSDKNKPEFDTILFADRIAKEINLPPNIKRISYASFYYCHAGSITIPSTVTEICDCAFLESSIQHIEFEKNSNLQFIGIKSFGFCSLKSITIPSHVTKIPHYAFENTKNLEYVEFLKDSKLQIINNFAFDESSVERITIPSSVVELQDHWLRNASNLKNIIILVNDVQNISYYDGDTFIIGKSDVKSDMPFDVLVSVNRKVKTVKIPSFIKYISPYAFYQSSVESITIPSHITSIGCYAFVKSSIKKVFFEKNLKIKEIQCYSFGVCQKLEYIDIPDNSEIQTIDDNAFGRTSITSFKLPPSVKKVHHAAFYGCDNLQIIEVDDSTQFYNYGCFLFKNTIIMIQVKT